MLKYPIGHVHLVWRAAGFDIMSGNKVSWTARLISGTYMLQGTHARFNYHEMDPTCL